MNEVEPRFKQASRVATAFAGIAVALSGCSAPKPTGSQSSSSLSPEPFRSHEVLPLGPTEFGFTTHLHPDSDPKTAGNMTIDTFKKTVDLLAENNQAWLRFNILNYDVTDTANSSPTIFAWNEKVKVYDEAISYAKDKGLKIFLVTEGPNYAIGYKMEDYLSAVTTFYTEIAKRYAGQIDVWQILNEADVTSFKTYEFKFGNQFDEAYIDSVAEVIKRASEAIKSVEPNAVVTTNILVRKYLGVTPDQWVDINKKADFFFDRVAPYLDEICLDLYPDRYPDPNDPEQLTGMSQLIEYLYYKFGKPVCVSEVGLPVDNNGEWTEDVQGKALVKDIEVMQGGNVRPVQIILYEALNQTDVQDRNEQNFGLWNADLSPKKSTSIVLRVMQPAVSPIPTLSK